MFIFHGLTSIKHTHSPVLQLKSIFFQFSWPELLQKCKLWSNTMHETWLRQSQTFGLQNIAVIPLHYFYPYCLDNRQTKACTSFVKLAASSINMLCYCPIWFLKLPFKCFSEWSQYASNTSKGVLLKAVWAQDFCLAIHANVCLNNLK